MLFNHISASNPTRFCEKAIEIANPKADQVGRQGATLIGYSSVPKSTGS